MRTVEGEGGGARTVTVSSFFAEIYNGDEYDDETDDNNNDEEEHVDDQYHLTSTFRPSHPRRNHDPDLDPDPDPKPDPNPNPNRKRSLQNNSFTSISPSSLIFHSLCAYPNTNPNPVLNPDPNRGP